MHPTYIVGAGGIGCSVGYALCAAGARPVFVDADPHKVRWGQRHGVRVGRRPALTARFQAFEHWHPEAEATVILCTKCYDNEAVLRRLPDSATLIPIQNGFDRRIGVNGGGIEGIASFVSECQSQRAHTRLTRRGTLHLGRRHVRAAGRWADRSHVDAVVKRLSGMLRRHAPFRVELVPNILPYKYTKLMYNAAINPLAAVAGLDNGALLAVPRARRLLFALLRENYGILEANRIPLGKIGLFHPATVRRILNRARVAGLLAWLFYPTLRGSYCSMSDDLPRGRTEIEFFNRHLIDLAGAHPCPINRRLYELVKRMERDRTPQGIHRLDDIV